MDDKERKGSVKPKPRHHRHHRKRKPRKTLPQQIHQQYSLWVQSIRRLRNSRRQGNEVDNEIEDDYNLEEDGGDLSDSSVSTCGSSCKEEASHWESASNSTSSDVDVARIGDDDEKDNEVRSG